MARCAGKDETNNASPGRDNFTLMQSILTLLRSLHLYALAAHHEVRGDSFNSDHEFLGALYQEYLDDFDHIVEMCKADQLTINELESAQEAARKVLNTSLNSPFLVLKTWERELLDLLERDNKLSHSLSLQAAIQSLAERNGKRRYKLGQRA